MVGCVWYTFYGPEEDGIELYDNRLLGKTSNIVPTGTIFGTHLRIYTYIYGKRSSFSVRLVGTRRIQTGSLLSSKTQLCWLVASCLVYPQAAIQQALRRAATEAGLSSAFCNDQEAQWGQEESAWADEPGDGTVGGGSDAVLYTGMTA